MVIQIKLNMQGLIKANFKNNNFLNIKRLLSVKHSKQFKFLLIPFLKMKVLFIMKRVNNKDRFTNI